LKAVARDDGRDFFYGVVGFPGHEAPAE
jgi:hypothetical protein